MPQLDTLTFFGQALTIFLCIVVLFTLTIGIFLPTIYRNKKAAYFMLNRTETHNFDKLTSMFKHTNLICLHTVNAVLKACEILNYELKQTITDEPILLFIESNEDFFLTELLDVFIAQQFKNENDVDTL